MVRAVADMGDVIVARRPLACGNAIDFEVFHIGSKNMHHWYWRTCFVETILVILNFIKHNFCTT